MLKIPPKTEYVIKKLLDNGFEAYIVGGCVRDMLLGKTPNDFDVTTSAEPDDVIELFDNTVPTGIKHGTVTVIVDSIPIEVTTFRTEGNYTDCRRPDNVQFIKSLKEDLARRDFTVNAMAYNSDMGIVDYFSGRNDLTNKILRAVGNPDKRFEEDALRILRLFRFASVLDFNIDKETEIAALENAKNLKNISCERIAAELTKGVMGKNFSAIAPLISGGYLKFAGIVRCPDFKLFEILPDNPLLRLYAFLKVSCDDILETLNFLKESNLKKKYCKTMEILEEMPFEDSKTLLKEMLAISSPEILQDFILLKSALGFDTNHALTLLDEIIKNGEPYLISHLEIDGKYLKSQGISGKKIHTVLEILRKTVIKYPEKNTFEILKNEIDIILKN